MFAARRLVLLHLLSLCHTDVAYLLVPDQVWMQIVDPHVMCHNNQATAVSLPGVQYRMQVTCMGPLLRNSADIRLGHT